MKGIIIFTVGFFLFLSGGIASHAQIQPPQMLATDNRSLAFEVKSFKRNAFIKKEVKSKRKTVFQKPLRFSGKWRGMLYQPGSTLREKYSFSVRLYQKGRKITGFSRIAIIDAPENFGVMRLRGKVKRSRVSFTETKITRENITPEARWCIKSGNLKLTNSKGKPMLKGNWQGAECVPGTIVLRKVSGK